MATPAMLSGYHTVVTGTGREIGAAIAAQLATQGATLTLMGRDANALQATAKTLSDSARVQVVMCDVTDEASAVAAFEPARAGLGPISILVNNAGRVENTPFAKTTLDQWQRMLSVNLTGMSLCTQAALVDVQTSGRSRIVSIAGATGQHGYAHMSAYVVAKHGVIGPTRSLALEFAARGVIVNAVRLDYTKTDIVRESIDRIIARTGRSAKEALAELVKDNP